MKSLAPIEKAGLGELNLGPATTVLKITVKDGADGMRDISVYKETGDRFLPDKAFRHTFAVVKIKLGCNGSTTALFVEEKPNSVRTNRPLLEAIADGNNHSSGCLCLVPIEEERLFLKGKVLKVQVGDGEWKKP